MINRKLHMKENVYFIHPEHGVCTGTVKAIEEKHVSLKYKENGKTEYITMPIEELSLDYHELETKWKWSAAYRNIPEQFAEAFDSITWEGDVIQFLYDNLKKEAKGTAAILIKNYYGWDPDDSDK